MDNAEDYVPVQTVWLKCQNCLKLAAEVVRLTKLNAELAEIHERQKEINHEHGNRLPE